MQKRLTLHLRRPAPAHGQQLSEASIIVDMVLSAEAWSTWLPMLRMHLVGSNLHQTCRPVAEHQIIAKTMQREVV